MSKQLIIIRGPSGTGKSTIAEHLGGQARKNWFEADMFMLDENGDYCFDHRKLSECHRTCQNLTRLAFDQHDTVIVSNTFTTMWELEPYVDIANELDTVVRIIKTPGPWDIQTLTSRNCHGVPTATIKRFIHSYEPHPTEEKWTNISIFTHDN